MTGTRSSSEVDTASGVTLEAPYLGLRSFTEEVSEFFFGRDCEISEVADRIQRRPLMVLFGQSGLGKTSLLRAGVIPRLRKAGLVPILIRLIHDPDLLDLSLEQQVLLEIAQAVELPGFESAAEAPSLWELFHDPQFGFTEAEAPRPILIFDQFEEIFTLGETKRREDAQAFLESLACLVENRVPEELRLRLNEDDELADRLQASARPCRVVLTLRDDFLHCLERSRRQMPSMMENRFELRRLSGPQAFLAVYEPARRRSQGGSQPPIVSVETAEAIVRLVAGREPDVPLAEIENVPPLLSLICEQLNARRLEEGRSTIELSEVHQSTGQVLRSFCERCLNAHPAAVRRLVERKLISSGGVRELISFDAAVAELRSAEVPDPEGTLRRLVNDRLLNVEERGGVTRIELTHDVLAPVIARLRDESVREEKLAVAQAEQQARMEAQARELQVARQLATAESARAEAESARVALELKKAAAIRRWLALVMCLAVAAIGLAVYAWRMSVNAEAAREMAKLSEQAAQKLTADICLSNGRTAIQHLHDMPTAAIWFAEALRRVKDTSPETRFAARSLLGGWSSSLPLHSLPHAGPVQVIAFSLDGGTLATTSLDDTARLWGVATGEPRGEPLKHDGPVYAVSFSPDGHTFATASGDDEKKTGAARLWDVVTGKPRGGPLQHGGDVHAVTFSPDGRTLATGSDDKTARLWDVATGEPRGAPLKHDDDVNAVSFSPDGRTLATVSDDKTVRLWDVVTGEPRGGPLKHGASDFEVSFSRDGRMLATGSDDNTVRLWDVSTGELRCGPLQHGGDVYAVSFSPDGRTLATASLDGSVRLWDVSTGELRGEPLQHGGTVVSVSFSRDGRTLATGSFDETARLWDVATGRPRGEPLKHDGPVVSVSFSPDSRTLATRSFDKTVRLWDVSTGQPRGEPLRHEDWVVALSFSPDGRTLATGSDDKTARLWDVATGVPRGDPLKHDDAVNVASFSPNGRTLATGSDDKTVRLWDVATGRPRGVPLKHDSPVVSVLFSLDGRTLATRSGDRGEGRREARLWDVVTGEPRGGPLQHGGDVNAVSFSPDGRTLATGSDDKTARLWDVSTGQLRGEPLQHGGDVYAVSFSPDGRTLATGSDDKTARLWDVATGRPRGVPLKHDGPVVSVLFSLDGRTLATRSWDRDEGRRETRLWDVVTGEPRGGPLQHGGDVYAVSFSPDGRTLATASEDNTVRLWDVATGELRCGPLQHGGDVYAVSFSPDGRTLATASKDDTVRLWDVSTGQLGGEPLRHDGLVVSVSFSPDGRTLATASVDFRQERGEARLWDLPPPVPDDPTRVWLSVEVASWKTIESGLVRTLSQAEWLERKKELKRLGGDCLHRTWDQLTRAEKAELRAPHVVSGDERLKSGPSGRLVAELTRNSGQEAAHDATVAGTKSYEDDSQRKPSASGPAAPGVSGSEAGTSLFWTLGGYAGLVVLLVLAAAGRGKGRDHAAGGDS